MHKHSTQLAFKQIPPFSLSLFFVSFIALQILSFFLSLSQVELVRLIEKEMSQLQEHLTSSINEQLLRTRQLANDTFEYLQNNLLPERLEFVRDPKNGRVFRGINPDLAKVLTGTVTVTVTCNLDVRSCRVALLRSVVSPRAAKEFFSAHYAVSPFSLGSVPSLPFFPASFLAFTCLLSRLLVQACWACSVRASR